MDAMLSIIFQFRDLCFRFVDLLLEFESLSNAGPHGLLHLQEGKPFSPTLKWIGVRHSRWSTSELADFLAGFFDLALQLEFLRRAGNDSELFLQVAQLLFPHRERRRSLTTSG